MDTLARQERINQKTQEALVKTHVALVKRIARHLLTRLPNSVQFDDLLQAGLLGLLEAVRHYDETKGASFETYAGIRIRGYMLDEVRRSDWVPRSVYRNSRMIAEAVKKIENELGRDAKDYEIAKELGIALEDYYELIQDSSNTHLYGFDDLGLTDDSLKGELNSSVSEPHENVLREDMIRQLGHVMNSLSKRERLVLSLYYKKDLNLKEIGDVLGVSESRVSQIHSHATLRLRALFPE